MRTLYYTKTKEMRLDKFLTESYPAVSLGMLHKSLRQNKIKVNGKKMMFATRLKKGDEIRLYLPEEAFLPKSSSALLDVLYEDDNIIAVNKPSGLITIGQTAGEDSLLARTKQYLVEAGNLHQAREVALCHRLDTGTSGVVLLAKNAVAEEFITDLMHKKLLKKTYIGAVYGQPSPQSAIIDAWLLKNQSTSTVKVVKSKAKGAKSIKTGYNTLAISGRLSLLEITLYTGRTHQIRAQMAAIDTPILGDSKYGNLAINRELRCKYQCLCAHTVSFPKIEDKRFNSYSELSITAPAPWYDTQIKNKELF